LAPLPKCILKAGLCGVPAPWALPWGGQAGLTGWALVPLFPSESRLAASWSEWKSPAKDYH